MAPELRYWDSDCFIGWLAEEADKLDECRGVIRAAEAGNVRIVTSSLTLTEVIKLKGRTPLPIKREAEIQAFFQHQYIIVRQLDRRTAERARELIWRQHIDTKDSVHVATALEAKLTQMDTFDAKLIRCSGKLGSPPLIISRPYVPEQLQIEIPSSDPPET
jgi:predicted nucleic acid-binding protein